MRLPLMKFKCSWEMMRVKQKWWAILVRLDLERRVLKIPHLMLRSTIFKIAELIITTLQNTLRRQITDYLHMEILHHLQEMDTPDVTIHYKVNIDIGTKDVVINPYKERAIQRHNLDSFDTHVHAITYAVEVITGIIEDFDRIYTTNKGRHPVFVDDKVLDRLRQLSKNEATTFAVINLFRYLCLGVLAVE